MALTCVPETFKDLQEFYVETFSPLYDRFINSGAVAQELHAEMAAGLDHLFCKVSTSTGDIAAEEIRKVAGHLKRATFDSFKLVFENEIRKSYDKLMGNRYADVHDGKFRKEISLKWTEARNCANAARALERRSRGAYAENWHAAFDEWRKILPIADYFNSMLVDESVVRAGRMTAIQLVIRFVLWLVTLAAGVAAPFVWNLAKTKFFP